MGKRIETISAGALRKLMGWHWPGNVRELENLVERAVILTPGDKLAISLPEETHSRATVAPARVGNLDEQNRTLQILRDLVDQAATLTSGNTPVSVPELTDSGTTGAPAKVGGFDE